MKLSILKSLAMGPSEARWPMRWVAEAVTCTHAAAMNHWETMHLSEAELCVEYQADQLGNMQQQSHSLLHQLHGYKQNTSKCYLQLVLYQIWLCLELFDDSLNYCNRSALPLCLVLSGFVIMQQMHFSLCKLKHIQMWCPYSGHTF